MNFDPNKDYYGILGVTPTAELAVIKAAYKALAAIYHPDRNSTKEAVTKMQAINEAWEILSDPSTRKKYDEAIGDKKPESDAFDETDQSEDEDDAIKDYFEKDWNFALSYYPDLAKHASRLGKISRRLEIAYRAFVVSEKCFKERKEIAKNMEQKFLETYFGSNEEILSIARKLIFIFNDKKLLRELNEAVNVLGTSDPDPIVAKFKVIIYHNSDEYKAARAAEAAGESIKYGAWELVAFSLIGIAMLVLGVIAAYS
jgi:curved DNA-binding protein CbpA